MPAAKKTASTQATAKKPATKKPAAKKPAAKKSLAPGKTARLVKSASNAASSVTEIETADPLCVTIDRRDCVAAERRHETPERRTSNVEVTGEKRQGERRNKVARRRQIDPTTCEREYNPEEIQFMHAMDEYKRTSGRMFPTCSEILEVIRELGYQFPEATTASSSDQTLVAVAEAATEISGFEDEDSRW